MSLTLQIMLTGLAAGSVYGLVAVGHTLIYRLTGIVHLAFGDLVGLGVFVTLLVAVGTGPSTQATAATPRFLIALGVGLAACVLAGVGGYFATIQPYLARGSTVGWVAATLALAFAVRAVISSIFERTSYVFPDPLPFHRLGRDGFVSVGGASFQARAPFVFGIALLLALVANLVLERTRFGRGLAAIADDQDGAQVVGIPVERLVALAFGLVGGLAALAAIAAAPSAPFDVDLGALLGLKGLIAALVVRFASAWRSFAAGVVLGVVEAAIASLSIGSLELGPEYREVLPLAVVFLFLIARPGREAEALE